MNHFAYLRILNIVLSFALAGASFYISYRHEQDQIFRRYTAEVNAIASSLELELGRNIALLMSFRSFYQAFPQVEKSGFAIFSQNARQFNNGVYGMRYVSRVLSEQRIEFETSATERNGAESFITYQTRDGTFTAAPESDEYFPVEYAEPAAKNNLPIGYDLASVIETRMSLETAASNNQAVGARPITVTKDNRQSYIYFISLPLYNGEVGEDEDERLDKLKAFVVGLYDIEAIFHDVLENAVGWDDTNSVALDDYSGQSGNPLRVAALDGQNLVADKKFTYNTQLTPIADLQWFLSGSPSVSYFKKHSTLMPYMLSIGIILFSLMIEAYLGVLRRVERELQDAANVDALTRIPNRRKFFEQMNREWPRAQRFFRPVAMVIVDVDNFKKYNDIYGHVRGDQCLHDVAQSMAKCIHRPGDMLARYGGEEFAIILPETTLESAKEVAERCRQAVQDLAVEHKGNAMYGVVTVSMGIACVVPEDGLTYGELIEMADQALYESKEKGRNRVTPYRTAHNTRQQPA